MNKLTGVPLNIQAIVDSGQSFRWQKAENAYYNVVGSQVIKIITIDSTSFHWQTGPVSDDYRLLNWHLNLDKDYEALIGSINRDQYIGKAIKKYWGLRELRQSLFETIISYIISANNSVKLISRSIDLLSKKWGKKINFDGKDFYTFPTAEDFDLITVADLVQVSRIGFRAKYVKQTAKDILSGKINLGKLETELNKTSQEVCETLQCLPGVGPKVADCVALFALGHNHLVPFDVWMKRIFTQVYGLSPKAKYADLQKFAGEYFGPYAGWAHQFLFMYSREFGVENLKAPKI